MMVDFLSIQEALLELRKAQTSNRIVYITEMYLKAYSEPNQCTFALMDINGDSVVTYVYQIPDAQSEVKVDKMEFKKAATA